MTKESVELYLILKGSWGSEKQEMDSFQEKFQMEPPDWLLGMLRQMDFTEKIRLNPTVLCFYPSPPSPKGYIKGDFVVSHNWNICWRCTESGLLWVKQDFTLNEHGITTF